MEIILNEREYAEKIVATGVIPKPESDSLYILAKYFEYLGVKNNELESRLNEFMERNYKNYNAVSWSKTLDYVIHKAKRHDLIEIDYIPVTKNELKTVQEIENKELRQLAFTILCIAKFYNKINPQNNDWVNQDFDYIFDSARIQKNNNDQALMFYELKTLGLVRFSKIPENTNINVLYADDGSEEVLQIRDYRRLGFEYLKYVGEKFINCVDCGILMRPKTQAKRCTKCQKEYRREYYRIHKQNSRSKSEMSTN